MAKKLQETGIPALDNILNGGIPEQHTILLAGSSGTGKTLLSLEWLVQGTEHHDQNCLYMALTEPVTEIAANLQTLSITDTIGQAVSNIRFIDLRSTYDILDISEDDWDEETLDEFLDAIEQVVTAEEPDRLVLDSITGIAQAINNQHLIRTFVFELGTMLDTHDVTAIMTSEAPDDGYSQFDVEEFIADGIIHLQQEPVRGSTQRLFRIVKMRGHNFDSRVVTFHINETGLNFHVDNDDLAYDTADTRVSIGVAGIDEMMNGGVYERSTTLITGASGTGKTLSTLHFVHEGREAGENCLIVNFEESKDHLISTAARFDLADVDEVHWCCVSPRTYHPPELISRITGMVEDHAIDRIAVDSLTSLRHVLGDPADFGQTVHDLVLNLRTHAVTTLLTSAHDALIGVRSLTAGSVSSFADNIILLNTVTVDSTIERTMTVWKMRRSDHDHRLKRYVITENGMEVKNVIESEEITTRFPYPS
ncbi:ATPase domain-containing protein [Natrinema sp. 1APR25-10V2]|uniref:ATPase domain-containing protein n=1 Tax=Natrinema sp. 1APR25-10V2 TaxID=2951081 RepID=UPI0028744778|nr:ATPase domain-containing protein [Natrinema sp. 1APR25-10V2]MDS0476843.1 AAA family ATPase [Natrinema sp. 1APR25-10V2]